MGKHQNKGYFKQHFINFSIYVIPFHFMCYLKKLFVLFCHVIVIRNEIIWLIHIHWDVSRG